MTVTRRVRTVLWNEKHFMELGDISVSPPPPEMTRKVAIPGWQKGMRRRRLFPKVQPINTQWM